MENDEEEGFGFPMFMGSETTEAEKEFERVLEELRETEGLKRISDVYTKLYDTYGKLKDELAAKNDFANHLQNKLNRFDDNLLEYVKELKEAQHTIEKQKLEIDEARALADAMHARELASVESFETIKKSVIRLEKELEARKRAGEEEAGPTSAVKEKEKFEKEKIRLTAEADNLRFRLESALRLQEELEQKSSAAEAEITRLAEAMEEQENNAVRQNRLVEHLKTETTRLKHEIESKQNMITSLQEKLAKNEKTLERRDKQLKEMTTRLETAKTEHEHSTHKVTQLKDELKKTNVVLEQTKQQFVNTSRDLKSAIADGTRLRNEMAKISKQQMRDLKRFQLMEGVKGSLELDRDRLRQQVTIMERELAISRKQSEADHREIENLQREKDIMNKNLQKIQMEAMENLQILALQEHKRKTLEHEIDANIHYIAKQRQTIRSLEKLRDRMMEETIALNEKIDDITDEVRLRNSDILELKKGLSEELIRTRKLTVSLDTIRAERNMLHKNYTEALDEILDLKQKLKMLAYQIEQLKEDLGCKESNLKSCEAALGKCNKKCEQLRTEIQNQQVRLSEARADIAALKQEEARLNRIVQDGDIAKAKLVKELEGLMNERDVVGAQLVRRNDEISLLYEKIRILEITLQRGERQYEQRLEDIRLLRLEILRLRKEKNLLSKGIENMTDLRLEVFNLERELGRERLRVRALEEALETPLNVHRWRKLEGTDPESVQLTQKLRVTQKKVLAQSEMLVLKDRELKETRNLYSAVKDMLALQPSPEVKQTLTRTQRALAARTSKMKCLIAELNMREHQLADLRLELDRVNSDLHTYKQRYFDMKRVLDADEARRLRLPSPASPTSPAEQPELETKEQRISMVTDKPIVLAVS